MSDLGFYALRLALLVAAAGTLAGALAGFRNSAALAAVARRALLLNFALCSLSLAALFHAFATLDFQLEYVANHAARSMAPHYRMAALWGGQAGSLLLWCWMLSAYAAAALPAMRRLPALAPWASALLLGGCIFFLALLCFVSDPFEKLPPAAVLSDGAGLNPLLQHPAMMIHPLMLYTGLTGFSLPFAFGFAALAAQAAGSAWLRATRRFTLWAWCFLSIGILLGGRWAYEVLGWGGYWAWDPVENASLMPWLAATAYLHSVMVQEKRGMLRIWNLALVGLTYTLCLFGTMITRSGLVRSVHAFAQTEIFGVLFAGFVLLSAGLFFGLLIARLPRLRAERQLESVVSREAGFIVNNWLFMALLAIVFWGTLFPKLSDWLAGREILIGPGWFNGLTAPVALPLLLLTGVGPLIAWRRATPAHLRRHLTWPGLAGAAAAVGLALGLPQAGGLAIATWAIGAFVLVAIAGEFARALRARARRGEGPGRALAALLRKNQRRYGGYIVHMGMVLILCGVAGSALEEEQLANVRVGDAVSMRGYRLEYRTARPIRAQHYGGAEARLALFRHGAPLATLTPEKRIYWLEQQPASIPAIWSTLGEDLYVVLSAIEQDGSATLKVHYNPLVNWIWIGGCAFILGTLLVMWPLPRRAVPA